MRKRLVALVGLVGLAVIALLVLCRQDVDRRESKEIVRSAVLGLGPIRTEGPSRRAKQRGLLRLEGQVIDDAERPVAGAMVATSDPDDVRTTTEADGTFVFEGLAEEHYSLLALKDGLVGTAHVRLRSTTEPVIIRVHGAATVTVRVIDADGGAPIGGAQVRTWGRTSQTDEDGSVRFTGVTARNGYFDITSTGYEPARLHVYPSDDAMASVARTVALHRGAAVSGTVIDPMGKPVADAEVVHADPDSEMRTVTDAMGRWHFDALRAGKHRFSATSEMFAAAEVTIKLDGKTPRTGVVIRVETGAQLVGTVVDPQGKPVAGARVWAGREFDDFDTTADANGKFAFLGVPSNVYGVWASAGKRASTRTMVNLTKDTRLEVRLVVEDAGLSGVVVDASGNPVPDVSVRALSGAGFRSDVTDRRGAFDFGGLPPGAYEVSGRDRDDIATDTVTANAGDPPVKLVLKEPTAVVGRVVLDGKPVTYYGIQILDGRQDMWSTPPRPVRTSDGRFKLERITAGPLKLVVSGPGFGQKRIDIHGVEGKSVDVGDVVVDRGVTIRGHVYAATGAPVAGATVAVHRLTDLLTEDDPLNAIAQGVFHTTTTSSGAYEISGIAPSDAGRDRNRISASDPAQGVSDEQTLPPRDAVVDLTLSAVGGIDGSVHGGGGHVTATRSGHDDHLSAYVDHEGRFRFDKLAPGDYEVALEGRIGVRPVTAHVVANARTAVTFEVSAVKILLAIRAESKHCQVVALGVDLGPRTIVDALELCEDGVGYIADVPPGAYQVCADGVCVPYRVTDQPPQQDVRIPAKR